MVIAVVSGVVIMWQWANAVETVFPLRQLCDEL
jgi:hypothetical protein